MPNEKLMADTLFDKLWNSHFICQTSTGEALIYIDRIAMHERTGTVALNSLADRGLLPRKPENVICVMDHIVDTRPGRTDDTPVPGGMDFITSTRDAVRQFDLKLYDLDDEGQGISHLVSAETGFALPGLTLVCPDSHTCTLGALGALAIGIGTSQVEHALATSTLPLTKPGNMRINFHGEIPAGVYAKDLVLYFIGNHGAGIANGRAVEFAGSAVRAMGIEERMTLCNMAVEFSAFTGMVAPDEKTFDYLAGLENAPSTLPREHWQNFQSDQEAEFDIDIDIDVQAIAPQVTWGTSPEHVMAIDGCVPDAAAQRVYDYMNLRPGKKLDEVAIDSAYIGSCTNARLSDLRVAAGILEGQTVAPHVLAICVPGSRSVKRQAEAEGLDRIFIDAGFQWREPGCGMCFYAGGEHLGEGKRAVTTTNRNFEGRQGPSVKSHLASPATVAASAVLGRIGSADMLGTV